MHILNKQTITIATALLLCFAGSHVCLAKPPAKSAAGAANHMQRGIELAQQKNFPGAIDEFTKAIEANPKDARGYANRSTAYRHAAQAAQAAGDAGAAATRYSSGTVDLSAATDISTQDEVANRQRA